MKPNIVETIIEETRGVRRNTAVVEAGKSINYEDLFTAVEQARDELAAAGLAAGQRVALLCSDGAGYIILSLAVLLQRAAIIPVPVGSSDDELEDIFSKTQPHFFVFQRDLRPAQKDVTPVTSCAAWKDAGICRLSVGTKLLFPQDYAGLDPAFIRFSSGTTGASKGVLLTHRSIIERTDAADKALRITSDDRIVWVLSMSFHFVVTILLFLRRGAAILCCGERFPDAVLDGLTAGKATFMYASPFHYHSLAGLSGVDPRLFAHVRCAISTSMKLSPACAQAFQEKFSLELSQAYGIIEVGLPFVNLSADPQKRASVGTLLPDYRARIDRPGVNGEGEVLLSGPGMIDAYVFPWQERASILAEGWFRTGDIGRFDADGYLHILGRTKSVINFAGMKVFPDEVEDVLCRFPGVREAYVFGVDHPAYGQLPQAKIVVASKDFPLDRLRAFCYTHLAKYKVPKEFIIVDALEHTPSGKIKRSGVQA